MKKNTYSIFTGFFIILFLVGCNASITKKGEGGYAFQNFSFLDYQVRYILTDIQLGGSVKIYGINLYDSLSGKNIPAVQQALSLWNQGVRVVNIDRFYRTEKPTEIMINSVPVGIIGLILDYNSNAFMNPNDVILNTDAQATIELPTFATTPESIPTPTVSALANFCDNAYWPIKDGAVWVYDYKEFYGQTINKELDYTNSISNLSSDSQSASFSLTVHYDPINTGSTVTYTCDPQGEIFDYSSRLVLVPENILLSQSSYQRFFSIKNESISVPAGQFDVISLCTTRDNNGGTECFSYARGIGLVYWSLTGGGYTTETALKSYSLP